jgi:hypothetical protein
MSVGGTKKMWDVDKSNKNVHAGCVFLSKSAMTHLASFTLASVDDFNIKDTRSV